MGQLSLNTRLPTGAEIVFDIDPLAHSVDVKKSSHRLMSSKIEFKLVKQSHGVRWGKIEGDEEGSKTSVATVKLSPAVPDFGPSYPSSSRKKKNWDALAADIQKEEDKPVPEDQKDPNAGGEKELNKLFQKLYADATEDQVSRTLQLMGKKTC